MNIRRRKTKVITIGNVKIGGSNPVAVQGMTKTETCDVDGTLRQIAELGRLGAEIVRLAVRDSRDAQALRQIRKKSRLPLVADIHFDWRLALQAIESGVDKIRLNPGNIFKREHVKEVAVAARAAGIPIRVGLNSGSVRRCGPRQKVAGLMVRQAMEYIRMLEGFGFYEIVVSLKASTVQDTVEAYRRMSAACEYPLHLGLTATGPSSGGAVKSAVAIGALLLEGIGDTIRVSLTDVPGEEIRVARSILEALGLRYFGPQIVSCPTCGRCEVDLVRIVNQLSSRIPLLKNGKRPLRVAVMGCVVNGPGEARDADMGIAFGKREGLFFKSGRPAGKVPAAQCTAKLLREIAKSKA